MLYEPIKKCKIGYIKLLNAQNETFFDKIKFWLKCNCANIESNMAEGNIVYEIPINKEKLAKKKLNTVINKLNFQIYKEDIEAVVLSNEVRNIFNQPYSEELINFNVPILNGKFLMKNLLIDIIEKILELRNQEISMAKVYILVEKYNKENLDILYDLATKVKNINIVTTNIKNFKKVEERLFENNGVAIAVANNRKKGLKRAELVVNFDFDAETIKKYNINRDAIIVNCNNEILDLELGFSGVVINGIKIAENMEVLEYFKIYDLLEKFDVTKLYESLIFGNLYDRIIRRKCKDNVLIKDFIGHRGVINIKELQKL